MFLQRICCLSQRRESIHEFTGFVHRHFALLATRYNPPMPTEPSFPLAQRLAARFYFMRGNLHRHLGNASGERREYQWAVDDFSRALDRDPTLIAAYYNRGVLYWRELENWHRAVRDLTRVIELAPHRHEAWFNRAMAFQQRGQLEEAADDLRRYLEVATDAGWRANAQHQLDLITTLIDERRSA